MAGQAAAHVFSESRPYAPAVIDRNAVEKKCFGKPNLLLVRGKIPQEKTREEIEAERKQADKEIARRAREFRLAGIDAEKLGEDYWARKW